jgi:hypothetical protein
VKKSGDNYPATGGIRVFTLAGMAVQLRRNTQLLEESALQAEIRRLKAELRQVTEERDILKEAACLSFSRTMALKLSAKTRCSLGVFLTALSALNVPTRPIVA